MWRRIAASASGLSRTSARICLAAAYGLAAGVGPNQSEDAIQREDLVVTMPIARPPRVRGRALPRRGGRLGADSFQRSHASSLRALQRPTSSASARRPDRTCAPPRGLLPPLAVEEPQELPLDEHARRRARSTAAAASRSASSSTRRGIGQPAARSARRRSSASSAIRRGVVGGQEPTPARAGRSPRAGRCGRAPAGPPTRAARTPGRRARRERVARARGRLR